MLHPVKQGLKHNFWNNFAFQHNGCYATSSKTRIETLLTPIGEGVNLLLLCYIQENKDCGEEQKFC